MTQSSFSQVSKKFIFGLASLGVIIIALMAAVFVYNTASNSTKTGNLGRHKIGALTALEFPKQETIAPDISFLDKDGKTIKLSDFKGNIIVVNLWATWCPPCVREMPSLGKLANFYKDKKLKVVAISIDKPEKTDAAIKKLAELSGNSLNFYHDPEMKTPFSLGAAGFPTTIIYDENLREIARLPGATEWDEAEAQDLFDELLAK